MRNPWQRADDVPDDAGIGRSNRGLWVFGAFLWAVVLGTGTLVIVAGDGEAIQMVVAVLKLVGVGLGVFLLGWLVHAALRRLHLFGGTLAAVFRAGFLLVAFPVATWLLADHLGVFDGALMDAVGRELSIDGFGGRLLGPVRDALEDLVPWAN
ncbi:MAG: hypothetical protein ABEJ77_04615 [Halanaeroarchaeum sp.]